MAAANAQKSADGKDALPVVADQKSKTTAEKKSETTGVNLNWNIVDAPDAKLCRGDHIIREMIGNFSHFNVKHYELNARIIRACLNEMIPRVFGAEYEANKERIKKTYGSEYDEPHSGVIVHMPRRKGLTTSMGMIEASCLYSMGGSSVVWKHNQKISTEFLNMVADFVRQLPGKKEVTVSYTECKVVRADSNITGVLTVYKQVHTRSGGGSSEGFSRRYVDEAIFMPKHVAESFLNHLTNDAFLLFVSSATSEETQERMVDAMMDHANATGKATFLAMYLHDATIPPWFTPEPVSSIDK